MTYSVHQHWDPLKVCIVGKSYSPEFYSFIKNEKVRVVMERIARETEEDYQKLISLLESFNVKILRPTVTDDYLNHLDPTTNKIVPPPMTPRDYSMMLGDKFYWRIEAAWNLHSPAEKIKTNFWKDIVQHVGEQNNIIIDHPPKPIIIGGLTAASCIRIGKDLYIGTLANVTVDEQKEYETTVKEILKDYRIKIVDSQGHTDAVLCSVIPGLIISLKEIDNYAESFPNWEVVYLPGQSWDKVIDFLYLKNKNYGKWWVPGEELNDDFTSFVEEWLSHWVGYVEETVFDVNMLVIDKQNVVCNNYNKEVFDAFERHGVTPHIINFRHRYFWDGGLHCITSDLDREGVMEDYFPERG
jgi:glycine amidinotransferase